LIKIEFMCQFSLSFGGAADVLMQRARQEIERTGGSFSGDGTTGNFQARTPIGSIHGSYNISGQEIFLAITKKPFLLSCKRIQKELSEVML
jgi:hypothetical protein